jgi:hypothetical protein
MDDYDKKTHTIKIKDIIFEILRMRLLTDGGEKMMRVKVKMGGGRQGLAREPRDHDGEVWRQRIKRPSERPDVVMQLEQPCGPRGEPPPAAGSKAWKLPTAAG